MLTALTWIVFVAGVVALVFYQTSKRIWLPLSAVLIFLFTAFATRWLGIIFCCVWIALFLFLTMSSWRLKQVTAKLLVWFRKSQPALSKVEQEVLQAGGLWWESEFFNGAPNWEELLHRKPLALTPEEQTFIDNKVSALCAMLDEWQIYQSDDLPPKVWDFIKREKFWGLCIEKRFGGLGFSALAHSIIITKIASRSMSAAITVMVPNSLGPAIFLEHYGTEAQQQYYLPRLATGEEIACFALTSPEAGSDATSIIDSGVVCKGEHKGKPCLGIRLNFDKRYITLAPICTLIGLAFKLTDPDHLLGDKEELGITSALVPSDLPGVEIGARHKPMTLPFMNGPIRGHDVFIPLDFVFGGEAGIGRGWQMMMECLSLGRGISLPSLADAANQLCFRTSSAYAVVRNQFKHSIGDFEGVGLPLAEITGYTYIAQATRVFTALAVDSGARPSIASAITKYHLTELARKSVNHAMDIHGGKAIQNGPNNYLAAIYNAIPISITVEGANILTRNLIVFGQGLVRCHPYLAKEMSLAGQSETEITLRDFDKVFLTHIGFTFSRFVRTFIYGITGGRFISVGRQGKLKYYLQQLTRMSSAFVFFTDVTLLVLGAKLKFKESLSARFGDIVSYFYMASSVALSYEQSSLREEETPLMEWTLQYCLAKMQQSFDEIADNYPNKFLGKLLRRLVFPFSRAYKMPADKLSLKIAKLARQNSKLRDNMTQNAYLGEAPDSMALLEEVFKQTEQAELFLKLVPNANAKADTHLLLEIDALLTNKKISQDDHGLLTKFLKARMQVIRVDEFTETRGSNERTKQSTGRAKQRT